MTNLTIELCERDDLIGFEVVVRPFAVNHGLGLALKPVVEAKSKARLARRLCPVHGEELPMV